MENSARKYVKDVKGIAKELMGSISHEQILEMDVKEFKLIKMMFELLESSCNIIIEQNDQMDRMENKIDSLIEMARRHK